MDLFPRATFHYQAISKFPAVRRDIAFIVSQQTSAGDLTNYIRNCANEWLAGVYAFDIYTGVGIEKDKKSIALALTFQHPSRTLIEEDINKLMEHIITAITTHFNATLRT